MQFDGYAERYQAELHRGVGLSGESGDFFARERVRWLGDRLGELGASPRAVVDIGCGTGSSIPLLHQRFQTTRLTGLDISEKSLELARRDHPSAVFATPAQRTPTGDDELVFCNGLFHHISKPERAATVDYIRRSLAPGGLFALWENNAWSPAARLVMWRIPFDRDADPVFPFQAEALMRQGGFEVLRTDFLFFFPRALRALRPVEPLLRRMPLGAQYLVLGRKR
jgi:SAM-dependent methyltransferase